MVQQRLIPFFGFLILNLKERKEIKFSYTLHNFIFNHASVPCKSVSRSLSLGTCGIRVFVASFNTFLTAGCGPNNTNGIFIEHISLCKSPNPRATVKSNSKRTKTKKKNVQIKIMSKQNCGIPFKCRQSKTIGNGPYSFVAFDMQFRTHSMAGKYNKLYLGRMRT